MYEQWHHPPSDSFEIIGRGRGDHHYAVQLCSHYSGHRVGAMHPGLCGYTPGITEWHEESSVEWFVKQLPRSYGVVLHDDTIPGVAIVSPKTRNTYFKKGSLLLKLFGSSRAKKYRSALLDSAFIRLQVFKYSGLIRNSDYFCATYYLDNNPDVAKAKIDPVSHYLLYGGFEGRNPSKNFDSAFYLAQNPDVKDARLNPLVHYLRFGKMENREPTPKQL